MNKFFEKNKIIKFFLILYIYYEEMYLNMAKSIKYDLQQNYILINKDWMRK